MNPTPCPDRKSWQHFIDGSVSPEQRTQLDQHLRGCGACRDTVDSLSAVTGAWVPAGASERAGAADATALLAPDAPAATDLGTLGIYQIVEHLDGERGQLLKAFEPRLQRFVAIRLLDAERASEAGARHHFVQAARAAASIDHENVVTVHAVDEVATPPFVVLEYVDGVSLHDWLARSERPALKEVVRMAQQAAAGLAAIHGRGLAHGRVRTTTLMLENNTGRVKLTDVGLNISAPIRSADADTGEVTVTLPPEQRPGPTAAQREDLIGLGGVLFALSTGRNPSGQPEDRRALASVQPWLRDLTVGLLRLDPGQPLPTATEAAELLRRKLIELQPRPAQVRPQVSPAVRRRRRRLAILTLFLLAVVGLVTSEISGWTRLLTTATPLMTGTATLVVQLEDPEAHIQLAGLEEGITEPGTRELSLRPGEYLLRIRREERPEKEEMVSLAWGGRQVVTVQREPVKVRERPFVVRSARGYPEQECASLAEAVRTARRGDVVEIHGNGPFTSPAVSVGMKALTIRAGRGYRPVIEFTHIEGPGSFNYLRSSAPLTLEGLELQIQGIPRYEQGTSHTVVAVTGGSLALAHCRIVVKGDGLAVTAPGVTACRIRNCELIRNQNSAHATVAVGGLQTGGRVEVSNSLLAGGHYALMFNRQNPQAEEVTIRVQDSTLTARNLLVLSMGERDLSAEALKKPPFTIEATSSIFISPEELFRFNLAGYKRDETPPLAAQVEAFLPRLVRWQLRDNLLPDGVGLLTCVHALHTRIPEVRELRTLTEWDQFWGLPGKHSFQERPMFANGDPTERLATATVEVTAADFKLAVASPGARSAGGQRLGVDATTTGPGPTYDRWRKTAEYRKWQKETGHEK